MIDLYEYNMLDETDKYNILWDIGVWLAHRDEGTSRYILYQLGLFYVELRYNCQGNKITGLRSFKSDLPLEPYLAQIDLSEINIGTQ